MTSCPKSPKEIVNEALAAFDLEFSEIIDEFKPLLDSIIRREGFNTDAYRFLEELKQIKFERKDLGMKLSDRESAHRLIGRMKNVRCKLSKMFGSDK